MPENTTVENSHNNLKSFSIYDTDHLSGMEATISPMPEGREVPGDKQTSGEDIEVKYKGPPVSEHFKFETVTEKERHTAKLGANATPTLKAGLSSLAKAKGLEEVELIRRALFAADENPEILFTPAVEAREDLFQASTYKRGGGKRGPAKTPN